MPGDDTPSFRLFPQSDKAVHLLIFGVTSYLLALNLPKPRLSIRVIAYTSIYGLIIECIQLYVPGRSFEWWDLLSDILGVLLGYLVFRYISHRKEFNS